MWKTVLSLCHVFAFFSLEGKALTCVICESNITWDDCEKHTWLVNCPVDYGVCIKYHRVEKRNDRELHMYVKGCGLKEMCNGKECERYGDWCQVDCCNSDKCNSSASVEVAYMMCSIFWLMAVIHNAVNFS